MKTFKDYIREGNEDERSKIPLVNEFIIMHNNINDFVTANQRTLFNDADVVYKFFDMAHEFVEYVESKYRKLNPKHQEIFKKQLEHATRNIDNVSDILADNDGEGFDDDDSGALEQIIQLTDGVVSLIHDAIRDILKLEKTI